MKKASVKKFVAHEVFSITASSGDRTDRMDVYPSSVEFANWREVVAAMRRILQANFVAIVSREIVEGTWTGDDDRSLDAWPAPEHIVSSEEHWRRYAADNPDFLRRVLESGATTDASDPHAADPGKLTTRV